MDQLEVAQGAVARLMDRIDIIIHNGWDKDFRMSYMSINEIRDKVRLIWDSILCLKKCQKRLVPLLNIHAKELHDTVNKYVSKHRER